MWNSYRFIFVKCLHCSRQRRPCPWVPSRKEPHKFEFKVPVQPLFHFFLLFQPQPTCLVVQCARAELQPSPPTRRRENRSRRRSSLRRGLPRLWPWPEDSRLRKGPSSSIMAACKFLISPTNALATPTQELFLDLRSVFPTGEVLPAAYLLWHAILQWLDIFHGRAALKQQNRQVNKPRPLSGAALFWFDFFSFLLPFVSSESYFEFTERCFPLLLLDSKQ